MIIDSQEVEKQYREVSCSLAPASTFISPSSPEIQNPMIRDFGVSWQVEAQESQGTDEFWRLPARESLFCLGGFLFYSVQAFSGLALSLVQIGSRLASCPGPWLEAELATSWPLSPTLPRMDLTHMLLPFPGHLHSPILPSSSDLWDSYFLRWGLSVPFRTIEKPIFYFSYWSLSSAVKCGSTIFLAL